MSKESLCKVELAKMLGLELTGWYGENVEAWEINELLKFEYQTIEREFNGTITVEIDQEDLNTIEVFEYVDDCSIQVKDLIWERAADEYIGKIKSLVETIKV